MFNSIISKEKAREVAEQLKKYCTATGCMYCDFFRHGADPYSIGNCALYSRPRDYKIEEEGKK